MNDEILIKFLVKETSAEENAEVQDWLANNIENKVYLAQFQKIWDAGADLSLPTAVDENEAWLKFKAKVEERSTKKETVIKPLKQTRSWLKIAAVFAIALGLWAGYDFLSNTAYQDVFSGDMVVSKLLPDGSELTINKNSEISFAKNFKANRSVHLKKGEVFFNVAHDKNNPFVIEINKVRVEVVGTSFNIKHVKNETEVIVETGIVKVKLNGDEIKLVKGERIIIDEQTKELIKKQSDDLLYNYYRTQLFVANNTPLQQLINTLNEAYGSEVKLANEVKDLKIFITLEQGSLEKNLAYICDAMKLKVSRNGPEILLSYK